MIMLQIYTGDILIIMALLGIITAVLVNKKIIKTSPIKEILKDRTKTLVLMGSIITYASVWWIVSVIYPDFWEYLIGRPDKFIFFNLRLITLAVFWVLLINTEYKIIPYVLSVIVCIWIVHTVKEYNNQPPEISNIVQDTTNRNENAIVYNSPPQQKRQKKQPAEKTEKEDQEAEKIQETKSNANPSKTEVINLSSKDTAISISPNYMFRISVLSHTSEAYATLDGINIGMNEWHKSGNGKELKLVSIGDTRFKIFYEPN